MNRFAGIAVDVLFVIACINVAVSIAFSFIGDDAGRIYCAVAACFCLLLAILLCVYPKGAGR